MYHQICHYGISTKLVKQHTFELIMTIYFLQKVKVTALFRATQYSFSPKTRSKYLNKKRKLCEAN